MGKRAPVMMAIAAGILAAAACSSAPVSEGTSGQPAQADANRNYLLESASTDFHEHGPAPTRFRGVRFGYVEGAGGSQMAILCGEFQTAASPGEWIAFATLKTSKYEQWIGGNGRGFCDRPAIGWDSADLSAELQRWFDGLE